MTNSRASINVINKIIFQELKIINQFETKLYGFIMVDGLKIFQQNTVNQEIKLLKM